MSHLFFSLLLTLCGGYAIPSPTQKITEVTTEIFEITKIKDPDDKHMSYSITYDIPRRSLLYAPTLNRSDCSGNTNVEIYCKTLQTGFDKINRKYNEYLNTNDTHKVFKMDMERVYHTHSDVPGATIFAASIRHNTPMTGNFLLSPNSVYHHNPPTETLPYYDSLKNGSSIKDEHSNKTIESAIKYLQGLKTESEYLSLKFAENNMHSIYSSLMDRLDVVKSEKKTCNRGIFPSKLVSWSAFNKTLKDAEKLLASKGQSLTYTASQLDKFKHISFTSCSTSNESIHVNVKIPIRSSNSKPGLLNINGTLCPFDDINKNVTFNTSKINTTLNTADISSPQQVCNISRQIVCKDLFAKRNKSGTIKCINYLTGGNNITSENEVNKNCSFYCVISKKIKTLNADDVRKTFLKKHIGDVGYSVVSRYEASFLSVTCVALVAVIIALVSIKCFYGRRQVGLIRRHPRPRVTARQRSPEPFSIPLQEICSGDGRVPLFLVDVRERHIPMHDILPANELNNC